MLGVRVESFRSGKRAGAESIFRPFTGDERAALADALRTYYRLFLSRVAEGRHMTVEAVDAVARGRVYSGDAALRLGLVDRLGGLASALIRARQIAQLPADSGVVVRPLRKSSLLDYVIGPGAAAAVAPAKAGTTSTPPVELSPQLRTLVRALTTLDQMGEGTPLALLPFDVQY